MWDDLYLDDDFWKRVDSLVNSGKYRIDKDGKLSLMLQGQAHMNPWVFIKYPDNRECIHWGTYVEVFEFLPEFCKDLCWKVVIYPQNVEQLDYLYKRMEEWQYPSKCGVDLRDYVPDKKSNYAAFIYADSKFEAKSIYKRVRSELPDYFNIIIKSGCTEHELDEHLKPNPEVERKLNTMFKMTNSDANYTQPDWLKNKIRFWWLKYARSIGDQTYTKVAMLPADKKQYKTYQKEVN